MIVVVPISKVCVPTWLLPVPVVAPVITQDKSAEQLSAKVASPTAISTVQSPAPSSDVLAEIFVAGTDKVGSILSTTVTSCVAVAVLPDASVTVQVTVVVPTGKLFGASFVVLATLQLSAVVALPKVTFAAAALHAPASQFTVTAAGAVIVGSILSTTVTVCVAVTSLPLGSTAVHVTVVVPAG